MRLIHLVPILGVTFHSLGSAFIVRPTSSLVDVALSRRVFPVPLFLVEDTDDFPIDSSSKIRRRRRKDEAKAPQSIENNFDGKNIILPSTPQQQAKTMSVQVTDIREIVSGTPIVPRFTSSTSVDSEQEYDAMDRTKSSFQASDNQSRRSTDKSNDSLERLLSDAKKMRQERKDESSDRVEGPTEAIVNALSTLVTADFFLVCGFLLWFLLGIFFSYVMHDDTVQIAFNGIFQPLVQPALGILMIGSALGAVLKKRSDE